MSCLDVSIPFYSYPTERKPLGQIVNILVALQSYIQSPKSEVILTGEVSATLKSVHVYLCGSERACQYSGDLPSPSLQHQNHKDMPASYVDSRVLVVDTLPTN